MNQEWLQSKEIDKLLEEYLNDPTPKIDLSEPGALEKFRQEIKANRNKE